MLVSINPGLIIWTIVTFVVLLILLRKIAWKHIVGALENREEYIRRSLELAERNKQESEHLLEESRRQIALVEAQAQKILNEGRLWAEAVKQQILEQANQQARKMIEQAKMEIERDKDAALLQLRGEVADLAILAAGKILDDTLDPNKHKKLVDDVLQRFPRN